MFNVLVRFLRTGYGDLVALYSSLEDCPYYQTGSAPAPLGVLASPKTDRAHTRCAALESLLRYMRGACRLNVY